MFVGCVSYRTNADAYGDDVAMDINSRNDLIKVYFQIGLTDHQIVQTLQQSHGLSISERHVRRQLVAMNLRRRCYGNLEDTVAVINCERSAGSKLLPYST